MNAKNINPNAPLDTSALEKARDNLCVILAHSLDGKTGVILVKWRGEFVTAKYRAGDKEWCYGHYFQQNLESAVRDYRDREENL